MIAEWSDALTTMLEGQAFWLALLIFLATAVVGTLLMLPAWIFPVAAGATFGWAWGTLAAVVAGAAGAQAAYVLSRNVWRKPFERRAKKVKTFVAVDKAMRKDSMKVVALLRLSPVLPSGLKSYLLGLTCVRPVPYALATFFGTLPSIALKAWIGAAGRDVLSSGGPTKWAVLGLGVVATVGVTMIVGRYARKQLGI